MEEALAADEGGYLLEPEWTEEELLQRQQLPVADVAVEDRQPDRHEILVQRMRGDISVEDWCGCDSCNIPQNATNRMCVCCNEQDWLDEKLREHNVNCITKHPSFEPVCLVGDVLQIAVLNMREVRGYGAELEWNNK